MVVVINFLTTPNALSDLGNFKLQRNMKILNLFNKNFGDSGRTRTPNLLIRSQLLYPVELRMKLFSLPFFMGTTPRFNVSHPFGVAQVWQEFKDNCTHKLVF